MATAIYEQNNGSFQILDIDDGGLVRTVFESTGYSGRGIGKNNANKQHLKNIGPVPAGLYRVGLPYRSLQHGPLVMRLDAMAGTTMFSRSGFLIHGDSIRNPGNASRGCIILSRTAREAIVDTGVRHIEIVPGLPA